MHDDVVYLVDEQGQEVAYYTYDPFGKVLSAEGDMAEVNPLRYRGYFYDETTGFYYLQSRYYDPAICRYINADSYLSTGQGFLGYNAFAYCANNPVNYTDSSGNFFDTIFDVISIGFSIADVIANPTDPWAWAGLAGDLIDLVPFVSGVGEATKAIGAVADVVDVVDDVRDATNVVEAIDNVHDASKIVDNISDSGDAFKAYDNFYNKLDSSCMNGKCFISGTLVATENGSKPIEEVRVGDFVWAWDEETGAVSLKRVVETYINQTLELVHITVSGEKITTTPSHPFYSPVKGWTDAVQLRAGDILVLLNGEYVVVEAVQHEILESPIEVYNFQVEDYHTYYVSELRVLVHNTCSQTHHIIPYSNKTYTPQYNEILKPFGLDLNGSWNKIELEGHRGRHTNAYHELVLEKVTGYANQAGNDTSTFLKLFQEFRNELTRNPRLPYQK